MGKNNTILSKSLIGFISWYQLLISPFLGSHCRFYPSCSCYAQQAINKFGVIGGGLMLIKRLLRCHPFHPGGYDPIKTLK